ncbi:4Fe-4S binding protein [Candidatus Woesearchaeota archaeon]|nr:4Fe-4S binding protein [Candidatus Woesearchaeota archaeon]
MIVEDEDLQFTGSKGVPFAVPGQKRITGDWRTFMPEVHQEKCIACRMCWVSCPESAITLDKDGYPHINYDICKGCLLCEEVCQPDAITHERDTHGHPA